MLDFLMFFIFISLFIYFIFNNVKLYIQKKKMMSELIQYKIDTEILRDEFKIKGTHEYIDFISKSRDEAYLYIEQLHESFLKYQEEVSSVIKHFDEFGIVASADPLHGQMVVMCEASKKLQTAFPKE